MPGALKVERRSGQGIFFARGLGNRISLREDEVRGIEGDLSVITNKNVEVRRSGDHSTLVVFDSNLGGVVLENCVCLMIAGGNKFSFREIIKCCNFDEFEKIVICYYGNDLVWNTVGEILEEVNDQLWEIKFLGGMSLDIVLVGCLTRNLGWDFSQKIDYFMVNVEIKPDLLKIKNYIGCRGDLNKCFKLDGTHLNYEARERYRSLLQLFINGTV